MEKITTEKLYEVGEVVLGKWRLDAPVTLEHFDRDVASTWDEIQDALVSHHLRQVNDVVQTPITKTDDLDLFVIEEQKFLLESMANDKRQAMTDTVWK